ncbi:MAG: RHS repeat-associated core domain-containing protein [Paludibacter sp.]
MIKNIYDAGGQKFRSDYYTYISSTLVSLSDGQIMDPASSAPTNYTYSGTAYLGNVEYNIAKVATTVSGMTTYRDAYTLSRLYNPEGYAENPVNPNYYYYRKDHLGNNREVWLANTNTTVQQTQYYPSGLPWETGLNPSQQQRKYNGKEFLEMHGWDSYDYGARIMYPAIGGGFMSIDPLCEKYYWISPYTYCMNNPVKYVDPDGRDGMVTGTGTKEDPYTITANYYYQNGSLNKDQVQGLNSAVDAYNNSGGKDGVEIKNADVTTSYIKYNLSAAGVDDVANAVTGDIFTNIDGQDISYGNAIGMSQNNGGNGDEFGSGNGWHVDINPTSISEGIEKGFNPGELMKSTYIHEIGHNLGLDDADKTKIMDNVQMRTFENQTGGNTSIYRFPTIDKKGIQIMFNRMNTPRVGSLGIIRKK